MERKRKIERKVGKPINEEGREKERRTNKTKEKQNG